MEQTWRAFGPGDVVEVPLPLEAAWPVIVSAALDTGACLFPLDPRLTEPERERLRARARPTHALVGPRELERRDGEPTDPDVAAIVATSGTQGEPRLVELTRAGIEAAVRASAQRIGDGPWLACLPPAHIGGLLVIYRAVLGGHAVRVIDEFDPVAIEESAEGCRVSLVPTMLHRLLEGGVELSRFETILVGGAGTDPALLERATAAGADVVRTYGQTESCGGVVYGGLALEGVGVRIADGGEIELSGPTLMRGYRHDPAASAGAFTPDRWLRTGDAGELDAGGVLRVAGRLDDVILTGGENVWPAEVEAVLRDHPALADVVVAGAADPEWGQRVVAFVVPADGFDPPTVDALRDHARDRLSAYKLPREVVLLDALPRNAAGKVVRGKLREARQ